MWNRVSGISNNSNDDLPPQGSGRNDDEQRHSARRSGSIASSNSNKKSSSRADESDPRGFNPTSTSYSSTTRGQYPGAPLASTASSYATASGNINGEPYMAPGLVRTASLADQMPSSSLSRSSGDQEEAREIRDKNRDKKDKGLRRSGNGLDEELERRQKRDKRDKKDKGLRRSENGLDEEVGISRGADDFPDQVASSEFSQLPGQYDGAVPGSNGAPPEHPAMSSHVQDQFPGQFPTQSSAPYRPPLAAREGGPGLAAEYYGDDGQSVAEQPGNRANTPSLITGAEPHLQPALAVAAPPPEPSASGVVGAAASFFSGEFEGDEVVATHDQHSSSSFATGDTRPNSNYHSSSAPAIPTIGEPAIASAAGFSIESQTPSHQPRPDHESSIGGAPSEYSIITTQRPPSQTQGSYYSSTSRPPKPGKQSSQSSNIPMYAVGAAGAAGLAAAAYEHNHHSSNQHPLSTPEYSTTFMAQRHRNNGPFGALVDFFKDPEGVAQFEEYSRIIGVCRHCFAPGSSPRDAPRKHFHGRQRANERYGSSGRVDKDSRYYSSEHEGQRKNNKSWLATGLAGYGLANVGESLFKEKNDSDDIYSVKTGRFSSDGRYRRAHRRSRSKERVETGITDDGESDRKGPRNDNSEGMKTTIYSTRRHSRIRSRSKDRKTSLTESAIGAALGTSVVASSFRRRSRSPNGTSVKSKHKSQETSPERRHKTKKKKKKKRDKGFFSFGNGTSSSSSVDLVYTGSQDKHRSSKRSNGKSKDDRKAEAALLGLGAAAAALGLNDSRQGHRKKGVKELVGVKETKGHHGHGSTQAHRSKKSSGNLDDEIWESAADDDYESVNSDLAYGALVRRDSRASMSSDSSGTNKWGWRWGSKKTRRASSPRRMSSDHSSFPAVIGAAGAGLTGACMTSQDQRQDTAVDSTSSLPLQHVYPVPTSDPSRFDVGREGPIASSIRPVTSSRPETVPLQHPRPIAPVSAAIYSSQITYDHSYSAPTGPTMFSQTPFHHHRPGTSNAQHNTHEAGISGSLPQQADDTGRKVRIRRRNTSPASFEEDSISSSIPPRRRTSAEGDSAVRFDLTEEQEERDRRERRRKRTEDKERREAEEQEQIEQDRQVSNEQSSKKSGSKAKPKEVPEKSSKKSWAGLAAAGVIGATISAAAATDNSRSEETREERRERRRRERELEDEEDTLSKSERRRRQRKRDDQEAAIKERGRLPDEISASRDYVDHQDRSPGKQDMSVWQEAASTKRGSVHENYGAFFTPLEFLNQSSDQVKVTSANADADIDLEQVPQIVTVEPKRIHDLSDSPAFSLADTDDNIDPSKLSFPWQVPRLRLVEPTPPSTRGSTPIPRPKDAGDEGFEEPRKEPSSSKVNWGDDQIYEYTVIAPKEDQDEFIESSSGEIRGTNPVDLSRSTHERDLTDYETHAQNDSTMESGSASYGEDAEFAATLAASTEAAGFDPSIVINNPTYRRRDSPPGSNERSMPGGFYDEDEPLLNKTDRKRKEKASRPQSQNDGPNGRDDDAMVQDIIGQEEKSESQPSGQVSSEKFDDEWESARKSRKKSKRDGTGFDDIASTVSSPSKIEASKGPKPKSKDKRKSSIWDRVLSKPKGNIPLENSAKDVTDEEILEDSEEPKKKSKMSKARKSTSDGDDDYDGEGPSSIGGTTPQISGRISQDLPAKVYTPVPSGRALSKKLLISSQDQGSSLRPNLSEAGSVAQYLDHGLEPEQVEEIQPKSFLGMRPEPPPPPNTRAASEELSDPLETASLPTLPCTESETRGRRFSNAENSDPTQTMATLPASPTSIPFHFRRPGRSSRTARSLSQTPVSSNNSAADLTPKQKPRPRSTEFKSSKEIRPLWLLERHRSHQERTRDESQPSLPSSQTTSKSSSVHDLQGTEHHQRGNYQLNEAEHEPIEVEPAPMIPTNSHSIQSGLLDSQQATTTASSFQDSRTVQDLPSPQASRDSSSKVTAEENPDQSSSTLKSAVLGAILGGSAAYALNEETQNNDPSLQDLSQEENEDFEHGSDDMVLDTVTCPSYSDTLDQEDFVPQKTKKSKKNKRKAGQSQPETVRPSRAVAVEAKPSMISMDPEPLSPESMRQLQEQDAQDAVDSWFPSALLSNNDKKGKKGKGRALVQRLPDANTHEPPRDNLQITVPADVQESDTLTRQMSGEQVVDIMTTAAQDPDKDENEPLPSATAAVQEPFEIPQDDFQENILPRDENSQEGILQDDPSQDNLPQDGSLQSDPWPDSLPALSSSALAKVTSIDPFLEHDHGNVLRSPKANPAPQEELDHGDFMTAISPLVELSPRATPLPDDGNDHDLSDERPGTPVPTSLDYSDKEMELGAENPLDVPHIQDPSTFILGPQQLSQYVPAQAEQVDAGDYFAAPYREESEKGEKAKQSCSIEGNETTIFQEKDGPLRPDVVTSTTLEDEWPKDLNDEPAVEVRQEKSETVDDEWGGFTSKKKGKKGKKAKQSFSIVNSKTIELQEEQEPLPNMAIFENHEAMNPIDESAVDVSQPKTETLEEEWSGFNGKQKGKKVKRVKPSFSVEDNKTTEIEGENQSLSEMAESKAPEYDDAMDLIDESAMHAPKSEAIEEEPIGLIDVPTKQAPKPELVEDKWTGFDSKKNGKKVEKQQSKTSHLGPGPEEIAHQFQRKSDARDGMNDRSSSLATTGTSQEVSAMLGLGATEAFPSDSQAEHELQKPSDQIPGSHERNLPVLYELATPQFENAPGNAHDNEFSPTRDTAVAGTNAAQVVQKILAGEHNAESSTDAQRKPIVASTGMEETATDRPIEENELDWKAPKKKKKGKKGKKNEAFSWDEQETIEPTEIPGSPGAMKTLLQQEPAVVRPIEEDKLDRDAPKKNKGKRGKKTKVFTTDESETLEPPDLSGPPAAMKSFSLEQGPAIEGIDEVFSNQSKKDKKEKKGKRKGVSKAISDVQDEDEPNVVPIEIPRDEDKAADLPAFASGFQEIIKPSLILTEVPQDDSKVEDVHAITHDSLDENGPSVVPTEVLQDDDQRSAVDLPSVTTDAREGVELNYVPIEVPQGDDKMDNLLADRMPPMRVEIGAPGEVLEPAVPTELAQDIEHEKFREVSVEQEQYFMPPKSKKDKKRSKNSKKPDVFPLDCDESPALGDRQVAGTKDLEKDGPEQTIPSSVDVVEESEKTVQKTGLEREEDFMLPTNKKDKKKSKKSKKFNAFSLDIPPTLEDEPLPKTKRLEKEATKQTLPSGVDVTKEPGTLAEDFPEAKKDGEESEEAQPFELKNDIVTAQSEPKTAQEFNKYSEIDSHINPRNASGDLVMGKGKSEEPMHGYFDYVSAHAAASGNPHKATSIVTSSLEQLAGASEEIKAYHANEAKGNIVPAEIDMDPPYSLKPSKQDRKKAKKARPLTEDEVSHEPKAIPKKSSATEYPGELSIIPAPQDSESWLNPKISAREVESAEIVQPGMRSEKDQGFQGSVLEEQPYQARDDIYTMVKAEQKESSANVKKGKKAERTKSEKLSIPEPEEDRSHADEKEPAWAMATSPVQGNEQTLEQQLRDDLNTAGEIQSNQSEPTEGLEREQTPILTERGAIDEAKDEELSWDVPVQRAEKPEKQHYEAHWDESKFTELSPSAALESARETLEAVRSTGPVTNVEPLGSLDKDEPIPVLEVEMLDAQEQRQYNEEYAKELERAVANTEPVTDFKPLGGHDIDKPIPAVEVQLLDAQEQRDYNEEYAKELERQLSPLREGERADPSRAGAVFPQSSISSTMERPYEEEHRPLARPPALEDIIEESRSRSGSVQGSPVDRDDYFLPFESTQKSKRGNKGNNQRPIIWEDETATPPVQPESDQGAKPSIKCSEGPGSWDTDAARPLDVEKQIDRRSIEDRTIVSPTADLNTASNESLIENDWSGDHFTIQPSKPAEGDVGREDTHEFRRALSTEPPFSSRDLSPAREPQADQDAQPRDNAVKAYDQDEKLGSLATDFHDSSRTEAEPAEEQFEENIDHAPVENNKKGKKAMKKAPARELSPQPLEQKDLMNQSQDLEIPTTDTLKERPSSRQHSSQPRSHEEDEVSPIAEGRPTSRRRSGSIEGVAAAMGLGVGTLAADSLSMRDSKNEGRWAKKAKKTGYWTKFGAEIGEPETPLDRGEMGVEEEEHRQTPESENARRAWQHPQATPPQSPLSANYGVIADHPVVGDLGQSSGMPKYRDSAIYVTGSPMISEEIPHRRAERDSGYLDTEGSPIFDNELENLDDPMDLERGVAAAERVGHVQHRHSQAPETDERQRSTSRDPFETSGEANSEHDVSVSRPKERRKHSRRRSGATYDSDDSADSGFDIRRRRRRQAMAREPRELSPVSSTSKNRSSALFDPSPSAREEIVAKSQDQEISRRDDAVRKEPTWSFDREDSPQKRSREGSRGDRPGNVPKRAPESTGYHISTGNPDDTGTSLFRGRRSHEDDVLSPSKSPSSSESRDRQRLNAVLEDNADRSQLPKKDKRAVSDTGSLESGVQGRRMRSPLVEDDITGEYVSAHDSISRQPWPAAGEENDAVDERSRSRNSEQLSTLSSRHDALPNVTPRHREEDYRTASAASMQSNNNNVDAIIRTPDQVRSASGLSYRSSGTPPLRHVDRSASGDLRGASKKSEAKSRAKSKPQLDAELDTAIPSSSTYDPITDKGKSPADMAHVYVSFATHSIIPS